MCDSSAKQHLESLINPDFTSADIEDLGQLLAQMVLMEELSKAKKAEQTPPPSPFQQTLMGVQDYVKAVEEVLRLHAEHVLPHIDLVPREHTATITRDLLKNLHDMLKFLTGLFGLAKPKNLPLSKPADGMEARLKALETIFGVGNVRVVEPPRSAPRTPQVIPSQARSCFSYRTPPPSYPPPRVPPPAPKKAPRPPRTTSEESIPFPGFSPNKVDNSRRYKRRYAKVPDTKEYKAYASDGTPENVVQNLLHESGPCHFMREDKDPAFKHTKPESVKPKWPEDEDVTHIDVPPARANSQSDSDDETDGDMPELEDTEPLPPQKINFFLKENDLAHDQTYEYVTPNEAKGPPPREVSNLPVSDDESNDSDPMERVD